MKLSMWTLMDHLNQYRPEARIRSGSRCLQSARLFSESLRYSPSTVYLIPMETDRIIATNENDILTLYSDDLNTTLNDILDIFEYHYDWETRFENAISLGCSAEDLLRLFSEMTGFYYIFADATFYIRAFYGPDDIFDAQPNLKPITEQGMMPLPILRRIHAMQQVRQKDIPPYPLVIPDLGTAMICNLFTSGIHRGWLIITDKKTDYTRGESDLMRTLADILCIWIEQHQLTMERAQKSGIFIHLLNGDSNTEARIPERLSTFGWKVNDPKQIHVLRPVEKNALPTAAVIGHLELEHPGSFVLDYQGEPVMITDLRIKSTQTSLPLTQILKGSGYSAGESPVFTDMTEIKKQYEAARLACRFTDDKPGTILTFQEAVLPYTFSILKEYGASDLRHPALNIIKAYDKQHLAEFYQTLLLFLKEQGNYTKTANLLHIHRSTLIYRIERIVELTGIDFSNSDERFHLLLSFYLDEPENTATHSL